MYFEYLEGAHGSGSLPAQRAYTLVAHYTMFWNELS